MAVWVYPLGIIKTVMTLLFSTLNIDAWAVVLDICRLIAKQFALTASLVR
jgi:hypothetical protein